MTLVAATFEPLASVADLALRAAAPLLVAALAAAVTSISIAVWWGVHDAAASLVLRTTFVLTALLITGSELWSAGTELFERSLARDAEPALRGNDGEDVSLDARARAGDGDAHTTVVRGAASGSTSRPTARAPSRLRRDPEVP